MNTISEKLPITLILSASVVLFPLTAQGITTIGNTGQQSTKTATAPEKPAQTEKKQESTTKASSAENRKDQKK